MLWKGEKEPEDGRMDGVWEGHGGWRAWGKGERCVGEKGDGRRAYGQGDGGGGGRGTKKTFFLTKACAISIVDRFAASVVHLSSQNTKEKILSVGPVISLICLPPCRIRQCWLVLLVFDHSALRLDPVWTSRASCCSAGSWCSVLSSLISVCLCVCVCMHLHACVCETACVTVYEYV